MVLSVCLSVCHTRDQVRNHGWKVERIKVSVPTQMRLRHATGQRSGWVLGAGRGHPLPLWGSRGITPEKNLKTQMLNHAFWWLLAVKFLAFWKLRPVFVPTVVAPMLMIHLWTVRDIKTSFVSHNRATFLVSWSQMAWSWVWGFAPNKCVKERHPLSKAQFDQYLR